MKKRVLWYLVLVVLPVLAVGLAMMPGSVRVVTMETGQLENFTYFDLLPQNTVWFLTPLAGLLALVTAGIAVGAAVSRRVGWLKPLWMTACAGAALAALPVLFRGEMLVAPNVGVPLLLAAEACVAGMMKKRNVPAAQEHPAQRLRER